MAELIIGNVRYRPIPGFSRYYAGENGDVLTFLMPGNPSKILPVPRKMKLARKPNGYLRVEISDDSRKLRSMSVHRCVLMAFVGSPRDGYESCHNNGVRDDNRLENLRWDTRRNNHSDKRKHGTHQGGEKNPAALLTELEVREIKRLFTTGMKSVDIAKLFNVDDTTISKIRRGDHWGSVCSELHGEFKPNVTSRHGIQMSEAIAKSGLSKQCVYLRLAKGMTLNEALTAKKWRRMPLSVTTANECQENGGDQ